MPIWMMVWRVVCEIAGWLRAEVVLDGGSVAAVMAPRRGLVLEAVEERAADGSSASFRQAEGPLASYRRRVEVAALGTGQYQARQVIDLKVGPAVVVMAAGTAVALLAGPRSARAVEAWPGQERCDSPGGHRRNDSTGARPW